jgi:putative peptidoglycan binding protein/L,D-transpeptidase-like protein
MAHFFDPRTQGKTDFFIVKACSTVKAALWNVGGPELFISSDDGAVAAVSTPTQFGGSLPVSTDLFEFFITGTSKGNVLIRAKNAAGDQWAFTQAVVNPGELCLDASGTDVRDLQQRLNCQNPTRLPPLAATGHFDVMTKARAMEFQFNSGLKVDGIVGSKTLAKLGRGPANCPAVTSPTGRCILADLVTNTLTAYNNGIEELRTSPVHGGSTSDPSSQGVFPLTSRRLRNHTSSKYPIPPGNMNFSLFFHGTEAIHQGPGSLPSHGCIHVSPPHAERLFNWAGSLDVLVIVVKR